MVKGDVWRKFLYSETLLVTLLPIGFNVHEHKTVTKLFICRFLSVFLTCGQINRDVNGKSCKVF